MHEAMASAEALADLAVIHRETLEDEPKTDWSPKVARDFMEQKLELVPRSARRHLDDDIDVLGRPRLGRCWIGHP